MLCDKCGKNEANVHITHIVNGRRIERSLCLSCAAQEEGSDAFGMTGLSGFLQAIKMCRTLGIFGVMVDGGIQEAPDIESLGLVLPGQQEGAGSIGPNLESLRAELSSAVAQEKYERAAELRDEIFTLEKELSKGRT